MFHLMLASSAAVGSRLDALVYGGYSTYGEGSQALTNITPKSAKRS